MVATMAITRFRTSVSHCCIMVRRYAGRWEASRRWLFRVRFGGSQAKARRVVRPVRVERKCVLRALLASSVPKDTKMGIGILQWALGLKVQKSQLPRCSEIEFLYAI